MPLTLEITVDVNGELVAAAIPSRKLLSDFLRDEAEFSPCPRVVRARGVRGLHDPGGRADGPRLPDARRPGRRQ